MGAFPALAFLAVKKREENKKLVLTQASEAENWVNSETQRVFITSACALWVTGGV